MPDLRTALGARPALVLPDGFPAAGQPTTYRALLDAVIGGSVPAPPYVRRLALPPLSAWRPGWIEAATAISDELTLPAGPVFGGYLACLADLFAGMAMFTVLPSDAALMTATVEVSFHRPVLPGELAVQARVSEISGRKALVDVLMTQAGQVSVTARATQKIIRPGQNGLAGR